LPVSAAPPPFPLGFRCTRQRLCNRCSQVGCGAAIERLLTAISQRWPCQKPRQRRHFDAGWSVPAAAGAEHRGSPPRKSVPEPARLVGCCQRAADRPCGWNQVRPTAECVRCTPWIVPWWDRLTCLWAVVGPARQSW